MLMKGSNVLVAAEIILHERSRYFLLKVQARTLPVVTWPVHHVRADRAVLVENSNVPQHFLFNLIERLRKRIR